MKWLGRQDSNLGSRDQNPLPYRLATPHWGEQSLAPVEEEKRDRDDREDPEQDDRGERQQRSRISGSATIRSCETAAIQEACRIVSLRTFRPTTT